MQTAKEPRRTFALAENNLTISKNSVLCKKHWPAPYPTVSRKGKIRPREPPSVWPGVPQSCMPTRLLLMLLLEKTLKSSFEVRGAQPDEMNVYQEQDHVNCSDIVKRVISNRNEFRTPTVAYKNNYDTSLYIQSAVLSEGVPKFIL